MIYDEGGLPRDSGASDWQDSARLAGIVTVFNFGRSVYLPDYVKDSMYVRYPHEDKGYDFSRDQLICLTAGMLKSRNWSSLVDLKYFKSKDVLSPSQKGHILTCQGKEPSLFQKTWLWFDVLYACFVDRTAENNQLLCMLMVNKNKSYLQYYLNNCKFWRENIRDYWSGWRGEPALAEHIIKVLEEI